ncbi:SMI1/KNR4 family protein [Kitasatospora sp. NPDC101801]|uniref:SMI1/KNR4 family protein n=1 Tax=Kitasatospora sp. NPDC101801 TaxID=3364103 RepID=UPI00381B32CD
MTESEVDWPGVREQVLGLRAAPFREKVFGAERGFGHEFQLEPPLSEAEVTAAEEELGISFPSAYRTFLLEVGAGGAGPHYGLFVLRHDERGWHWADEYGHRTDNALLDRPFPSVEERARWEAEYDAREPDRESFPDERSYLAAFRDWDDEWDTLSAEMTAGAIPLSHQGCGGYTWLVVTGPERDTLWSVSRANEYPTEPLSAGANRVNFRDWYLSWLTKAAFQAHGGAPGGRRLRPVVAGASGSSRLARWFGR